MRKIGMIAGAIIPLLGLVACGSKAASEKTADKSQDTAVIVSTARIAFDDGSEEKLYHAEVQYGRSFKFAPQADGIATRVMIRPGQKVSEGQALIAYPAQNHQLQVEQQQAIYKDMQGKLEKQQALLAKGFVARQTVEDLELEVKNKAKEIRILEEQYVVKAPFSGTITDVSVTQGDHVVVGTQLFILSETDKLSAEFFASMDEALRIKEGDDVALELGSLPELQGKVTQKSTIMDDTRKAYRIRAEFNNQQAVAAGGVTANVRMKLTGSSNSIRVPLTAVASVEGKDLIYKCIHGQATATPVRIVRIVGQQAVVEGSVEPGDEYVIVGVEKISDKSAIKSMTSNL
ncbi:efflux RND transporter periplasmic adaptor subunit [Parabacteroides gordonii]|uniref:Efflux transporter, RND family, MFP subunit n=1 Tax=Parabacteroides gordonii MS-1 = DSM 23371 TaxID=1203610 RepID=A0A0F5IVB4_9BACT|nr:efflux RND transporter periplasmic adaptor subunit [Parabacteroides gordonii]KKB49478.1 efflux transporter, RND family, MFP subunit [Parabacteroides gordonii MS-1 = DSM 23371]MCA5585745.1 efflux RND transporter periplasmic adaptor subunit [Parabacteroides gordonii]